MEQTMTAMFAMPAVGLEDRLIARLREPRRSWRPRLTIHPAVARASAVAASVMLLAGAGYVVSTALVPSARVQSASNLRQLGESIKPYRRDWGDYSDGVAATQPTAGIALNYSYQNAYPATNASGRGITLGGGVGAGDKSYRGPKVYWDVNGGESKAAANDARFGVTQLGTGVTEANKPQQAGDLYAFYTVAPGQSAGGVAGSSSNVAKSGTDATWFTPTSLGRQNVAELGTEVRDFDAGLVAGKPIDTVKQSVSGNSIDADLTKKGTATESTVEQVKRVPMQVALVDGAQAQEPPAAGAPPVPEVAPTAEAKPPAGVQQSNRKIIRNGQMEFEVDRFDAAFAQVSKLTTENGGYVGTTDSEKLPNGKV
jgi:hypothetical protein